jgi:nucleoside-diphosphate-sugar epimerase
VRVVITGASGVIGSVLRERLAARYDTVAFDRRREHGAIGRLDTTHAKAVTRAFAGAEAVIDLAASSTLETPWPEVWKNNVPATMNALEAARVSGAKLFVFASSNHVTGGYEHDPPYSHIVAGRLNGLDPAAVPKLDARVPLRPDSPYAVGKALGEAAARYYAEQHGLRVICLRIGTVRADDTPTQPRHYATLLTHADLVQLYERVLESPPDLRFGVYYGVSANTWRFWDIEEPRNAIGFQPQDDAERLRSRAAG